MQIAFKINTNMFPLYDFKKKIKAKFTQRQNFHADLIRQLNQ